MHQFEEIVLYLVRLVCRSVGARDEKLNWTVVVRISCRDNGQPFLEDFNEDDRANFLLLVHIFLDELDEELIDLDLEIRWNIAQVLRFKHQNNGLQGGTVDDLLFREGEVANHLAQNHDHVIVNASRVHYASNAWPVEDLEQ